MGYKEYMGENFERNMSRENPSVYEVCNKESINYRKKEY